MFQKLKLILKAFKCIIEAFQESFSITGGAYFSKIENKKGLLLFLDINLYAEYAKYSTKYGNLELFSNKK